MEYAEMAQWIIQTIHKQQYVGPIVQFVKYFSDVDKSQAININLMIGYTILAKALAQHKLEYCFGIVGVPVIELGFAIQGQGITYFGCRNEQQASYAAGAVGFLTQKPGLCLCVSGPGHTNAVSGLANAWSNSWPMILLSGASDLNQASKQAFQECEQEAVARPYCKYTVRITDAASIPFIVEKAIRKSITGRPGPVYLELPGDLLKMSVPEEEIRWCSIPIEIPIFVPPECQISKAIELLKTAKNPLVIIGKGAAYSGASSELTEFINKTQLPFLPTPLGKGVVADSHNSNISAARSTALGKADLVLLVGARLNWILHFGHPPRFDPKVKVIQVDIAPEEMSHNVTSSVQLVGDCKEIFKRFNSKLQQERFVFPSSAPWNDVLQKKSKANTEVSLKLMREKKSQMTYYTSGRIIKEHLPKDCTLIGEGANTMDIGRTIFTHEKPLRRLDAGSFGTMGIGIPFVLAAKAVRPTEWVVAVMGDSAFGFSAMECETLTRYRLGAVIFIINNNGIYSGVDKLEGDPKTFPVTGLNPDIKYELLGPAFSGYGVKVQTEEELEAACKEAFKAQNLNRLTIINVAIEASSDKKPQEHAWLTRDDPKSKL